MQSSGPGLLFSDSGALGRAQESAFSPEAQGLLDTGGQGCARDFRGFYLIENLTPFPGRVDFISSTL